MMYQTTFLSPIGDILLQANDTGLTGLRFLESSSMPQYPETNMILDLCCKQLAAYFAGERTQFDVPLAANGTPFQQQIWQLLNSIPFGNTISYHGLSQAYGDVKAIRAIAAANGKNKIAILIPCHRVVGSNGELTGFAWGLERKKWLLDHEARHSGKNLQATLF